MRELIKQWTTRKEIKKRPVKPITTFFPMEEYKKPDFAIMLNALRENAGQMY